MIKDNDTNYLYLSPLLESKYPMFYKYLMEVIIRNNVKHEFLLNTKDVWCVDFMPIQINDNDFIQFVFNPSYLQYKKYKDSITNTDDVVKTLNLNIKKSDIILDGGNICNWKDIAIITNRVFKENKEKKDIEIYEQLKKELEVNTLIIIPELPHDFTGHADGMIRFIDRNTIIMNDFSKCSTKKYYTSLKTSLINAGLNLVELPNESWKNTSYDDITGDYINFLRIEDILIIPSFGSELDKTVENILRDCYSVNIETVRANDLAKDSGLLNCISWNIKK